MLSQGFFVRLVVHTGGDGHFGRLMTRVAERTLKLKLHFNLVIKLFYLKLQTSSAPSLRLWLNIETPGSIVITRRKNRSSVP